MPKVNIWRLETTNGVGVYRAIYDLGLEVEMQKYLVASDKHPGPSSDKRLSPKWEKMGWLQHERFVFGFKTLEQYLAWFDDPGIRKKFAEKGLVLREYKVERHHRITGDAQIVFERGKAELLREISPAFV